MKKETKTNNELLSGTDEAAAESRTGAIKILLKVKDIVVWTFFALTILIMIFTIISSIFFNNKKGEDKSLFGLTFNIVLTDSMKDDIRKGGEGEGAFASGDLIIGTRVDDPSELKVGDIITFVSNNDVTTEEDKATYGSVGATVSHEIYDIKIVNGQYKFYTFGTTTGNHDKSEVDFEFIRSKYSFTMPLLGHFFQFVKTTPGYIVCILVPFILIIALQIGNVVKAFRNYKREQLSEMVEERARLEEDKQKNAQMMEELLALKAELEKAKAEASGQGGSPSAEE
jgi:signal peptidase I